MTKREEIREGIKRIVAVWEESDGNTTRGIDDRILEYLHSQGVVIKVERELKMPEYWAGEWYIDENGNKQTLEDAVGDAGYVAVEPLIKEKNE